MEKSIKDIIKEEDLKNKSATIRLSNGDWIYYDFSKSHMTEKGKLSIEKKLQEINWENRLLDMWKGKNVNYTENRPVLHYLLREKCILQAFRSGKKEITLPKRENLKNEANEILEELYKISAFTNSFKSMKGITGQQIDTIVNIGIGGSDLGPRFVTDALQFYSENRKVFFISNVDPTDTIKVFKKINPEKTLFIVVSKTFTTIETIENFKLVLGLIKSHFQNQYSEKEICNKHFVAVTSNTHKTSEYGIESVFRMWDSIGGRYSLWSAVGLSICLYVGFDNYMRLLQGASEADEQFFVTPSKSISAMMALNEIFYAEMGYNNKCIVCYDSYLEMMHKYLQQLEMESNGKHHSKQMIIWGGVGTDVQHSFFQLLHQGMQNIYLEFLCPSTNINLESTDRIIAENKESIEYHHKLLAASCFAQSRSLMVGKESESSDHRFPGNKSSVTIVYSKLTPEILGSLLSVYENKVFVSGLYYNINSFDQFGVELGKIMTKELMNKIENPQKDDGDSLDPSTEKLLSFLKKN